jgi:hypothetical protein
MKNIAIAFGILLLVSCGSFSQTEEAQTIDTLDTSSMTDLTMVGDSTVSATDTVVTDSSKTI